MMDPDTEWLNRRKIFLAHVQKTAGTAINNAFLNFGLPNPSYWDSEFVEDIAREGEIPPYAQIVMAEGHLLDRDGLLFRGWAHDLTAGGFFYAFSHQCVDEVRLPEDAFVFTALRDPVARVISHYSEIERWYREGLEYNYSVDGSDWKSWLGRGFEGYLECVPRRELMNHLYVYGGLENPARAIERLEAMDFVLFNDNIDAGFRKLGERLGLRLELPKIRVQRSRYVPDEGELAALKRRIEPELEFFREARARLAARSA